MRYKVGQEVIRIYPKTKYHLQKVIVVSLRARNCVRVRAKDGYIFSADTKYIADEEEYLQYQLGGGAGIKK